ncbi:MAG: ATP-grasp domain-containing protein [Candidatus Competibacteraceae bacterium]|nr:ATP-grasp domain-containing protein [Candidatus Competibacteraceae bacterium]
MNSSSGSAKILILDGDLPPALTIARSLRRKGLRIEIGSHETHPLAGYSNTVRAQHRYPNPLEQETAFITWIAQRLSDETDDLVIPVTERTVNPLLRHRHELNDTRLALAPSKALKIVLDKARTVELAQQLGIPTPASRYLHDPAELAAAAEDLSFPIVIKPVSSIGSKDAQNIPLTVSYALNPDQLRVAATHTLRYGSALLQEYFTGDGVGIELIADRGRIVYAFQHIRMHELPLTGGGSCLRQSTPITPALLSASTQLIAALHWHGVAMVEFKHNAATGEFRLIEINGRFWGSLPLAVAAGADFPAMLYELLVEGAVQDWPPPRDGVICRNLSRDVHWHEAVLRRDVPTGPVTLPATRQVLKDLALVFSPRHCSDVQQWRDPKPGLVDIGRLIKSYATRITGQLHDRWQRRRQRAAWRNGQVAHCVSQARRILFICYGNINRSAVAHRYAERVLSYRDLIITSAGFHPQAGRPADPTMIEVAAEQEIDMHGWSSQSLNPALIQQADVIFVMELAHYQRLAQIFPKARSKTFLLGMGLPDANGDIPDPYGKARTQYQACLRQVMAGVEQLAHLLKKQP